MGESIDSKSAELFIAISESTTPPKRRGMTLCLGSMPERELSWVRQLSWFATYRSIVFQYPHIVSLFDFFDVFQNCSAAVWRQECFAVFERKDDRFISLT